MKRYKTKSKVFVAALGIFAFWADANAATVELYKNEYSTFLRTEGSRGVRRITPANFEKACRDAGPGGTVLCGTAKFLATSLLPVPEGVNGLMIRGHSSTAKATFQPEGGRFPDRRYRLMRIGSRAVHCKSLDFNGEYSDKTTRLKWAIVQCGLGTSNATVALDGEFTDCRFINGGYTYVSSSGLADWLRGYRFTNCHFQGRGPEPEGNFNWGMGIYLGNRIDTFRTSGLNRNDVIKRMIVKGCTFDRVPRGVSLDAGNDDEKDDDSVRPKSNEALAQYQGSFRETDLSNTLVQDCTMTRAGTWGIDLANVSNILIENTSIDVDPNNSSFIANCIHIEAGGSAIRIRRGSGFPTLRNDKGQNFRGIPYFTQACITILGGGTPGSNEGGHQWYDEGFKNISITGMRFVGTANAGIYSYAGATDTLDKNLSLIGGRIRWNNFSGLNPKAGGYHILLESNGSTPTNNNGPGFPGERTVGTKDGMDVSTNNFGSRTARVKIGPKS